MQEGGHYRKWRGACFRIQTVAVKVGRSNRLQSELAIGPGRHVDLHLDGDKLLEQVAWTAWSPPIDVKSGL